MQTSFPSPSRELEHLRSRSQELEHQLRQTQQELRDIHTQEIGGRSTDDAEMSDDNNSNDSLPVSHTASTSVSSASTAKVASNADSERLQEQAERMQKQLQEKERSIQELKQTERSLRSQLAEERKRADHAESASDDALQQAEAARLELERERKERDVASESATASAGVPQQDQSGRSDDDDDDEHEAEPAHALQHRATQGEGSIPESASPIAAAENSEEPIRSHDHPEAAHDEYEVEEESKEEADDEDDESRDDSREQLPSYSSPAKQRTPSEVEVAEALEHAERMRLRNEELEQALAEAQGEISELQEQARRKHAERETPVSEQDVDHRPQAWREQQGTGELDSAKHALSEAFDEDVTRVSLAEGVRRLISTLQEHVAEARRKANQRMSDASGILQHVEEANAHEAQRSRQTIRAVCEHVMTELERKEEQVKDAQWQVAELEGAADERDKAREAAEQVRADAERAHELSIRADTLERELESERKQRKAEASRWEEELEGEREQVSELEKQLKQSREAEESARIEASRRGESSDSDVQSERARIEQEYGTQLEQLTQQESEAREEAERWKERYESMRDDFTKWRERTLSMMESKDNEIATLQQQQHASASARVQRSGRDGVLGEDVPASAREPHPSARFDGEAAQAEEAPIKRVDWQYLQNVVAKFAETADASTHESLLPVIGTLLALDEQTMERITKARKQQRRRQAFGSSLITGY